MPLTWFRAPGDSGPGLLNLAYNAVDLHVIRGRATDPAFRDERGTHDFATLLELTAALGGALRGLGVTPARSVVARLDDPTDELLLFLACARLGAPYVPAHDVPAHDDIAGDDLADLTDAHRPALVATTRTPAFGGHVPPACLVRGVPPADPTRDLDWDVALRAGRTDPAPCAELPPTATAYVLDGVAVSLVDAPRDASRLGRACATLVAGQPLDLSE